MATTPRRLAAGLTLLLAAPLWPQGIITTIAGTEYLFPGDGKPANTAPLGVVTGVAAVPGGSFFLADQGNGMVMRVDSSGILRVVAGNGIPEITGDGGPARSAGIRFTGQMTLDAAGNIFLIDSDRVRRIATDGTITTVAGGGARRGDGIPALDAFLDSPGGVAMAADGTLYVSDIAAGSVYRVSGGTLRTFASGLSAPTGLAVDRNGNLYVAEAGDGGGRVLRVTPQGAVSVFAGPGGVAANLSRPTGVAVDAAGAVYIADESGSQVTRIAGGVATVIAGNGNSGFSGDGGPAVDASLNQPYSVAVDDSGVVYVGESMGRRVRRVDARGIITTAAGNGFFRLSGDGGPATAATLNTPSRVVFDSAGNMIFNDSDNGRVRRVDARTGIVTTIAGGGASREENVPAASAEVYFPLGLVFDAAGNLYIGEATRIRRVSPNGLISTFAGGGDGTGEDVPALSAEVGPAVSLAFDTAGNLYFVELDRNRVRRVSTAGRISTFAGTGQAGSTGDGGQSRQATLNRPLDLAFDRAGNLFIAESEGHRVRRVTPQGIISTVAGGGSQSGDGVQATSARLESPGGLAFDSAGNLYIADAGNSLIRRVTPAGIISTVAGDGFYRFFGDGGPATAASLNGARGIGVDNFGNLTIADTFNHRIRRVFSTAVTIRSSAAALQFAAQAGRAAPPAQSIAITSTPSAGLAFAASATTTSGGPWLSVAPGSGVTPANLQVSVNAAGLQSGDYQGIITIQAAQAPLLRVPVTLSVTAVDPAQAAVEPASLQFSFSGGEVRATQQIRVLNRGGGSITFFARATGTGLTVTPASITATAAAPANFTVTADVAGLGEGTYRGQVVVVSALPAASFTLPVVISVGRLQQTILLSQTGLTFVAVQAGGAVPPQQVAVLNIGQGVMNWTASASVLGDVANWLAVSPASGSSTAGSTQIPFLDIGINPAGLDAGEYYGQVVVDAPGADNSPQLVSVVLNILPAGSTPPPLVRPTGLVFVGAAGISPGSQDLSVSNLTAAPASYISGRTPEPPNALFTAAPSSGNVIPGTPFRIVVQPDFRNLAVGVRSGTLTLDFTDRSFQTIRVLLVVTPPPTGPSAAGLSAHSNCVPSSLQAEFTLVPKSFLATVGWPMPIETRIVDNCGHPHDNGSAVVSFSNGDAPLVLSRIQPGRWSGTWTPKRITAGPMILRLAAASVNPPIGGEIAVDGVLRANPNPPVVSAGGIVSAASFVPYAPLAPGGIVSIFGSALADGVAAASEVPLATRLSTTQVFLQGRPLPLFYVSEGQINGVVPYDVSVNTRLPLVVRRGARGTAIELVGVAAAQPAIFLTTNPAGVVVDRNAPARAGDVVVIYCEGLGAVDPPIAAGEAAPLAPLRSATAAVTVAIGGRPVQVLFAGLTPNFAGLYQVNAIVPTGVAPGDAVDVVITAAGQPSAPATIAVR